MHFGKRFTHCERDGERVVAHFADGTSDAGDVLVAADGINSAVRAQLRPADRHRDLEVRGILARTPRAKAVGAGLPEAFRDRFIYVIGTDGYHLGLMPMVYRQRPQEAAAALWPGLAFEDAGDYYMSVFSVHAGALGLSDEAFFAMTGGELRDLALDRTIGWHSDLHGIWAHADTAETYPIALRATVPVEPWEAGNVIPIGDAVHTMPPTGGVGANTAMRDASSLSGALTAVSRGELSVADASARYQAEMAGYATEAVTMSLNIAKWSKQTDVGAREKAPSPAQA